MQTRQVSPNYSIHFKNGLEVSLLNEDLLLQDTQVIVNAANRHLWLGGGVAGAILAIGGDEIQTECNLKRKNHPEKRFSNGSVIPSGKGKFPSEQLKYIFHAVGPIYKGGKCKEKEDLIKTFDNCFELAREMKISSIAIPPISSGIFKYPKDKCADVYFSRLINYIQNSLKEEEEALLKDIRMVIIDQLTFDIFEKVLLQKAKDLWCFEDKIVKWNPEDLFSFKQESQQMNLI